MARIEKFLKRICVQTALYWEFTGADGYGQATYAAPREIACRWEDGAVTIMGRDGKEIQSNSQLLVLEDLKEMSMLFLGKLTDIPAGANPLEIEDASELSMFGKVPMIKSTDDFVRTAYLNKKTSYG